MGMMALIVTVKKRDYTNINNQLSVIQRQKFVIIDDNGGDTLVRDDSQYSDFTINFKEKEYFGQNTAIDKKRVYGFSLKPNETKEKSFDNLLQYEISILKKINLSKKQIEASNYKVERNVYSLLDKKELRKKYPSYYESKYLSSYKLRKIRISYNKKYLPIRIEGYFEGKYKPGWHTIRKISYPKMTEKTFSKKMKEYIEHIKIIESEKEGD